MRHVLGHTKGGEVSIIQHDIHTGRHQVLQAPPGTMDAGAR
jgi:hypothetical protein